jgi:phosphoribosylformylglycinamidine synthase
MALNAVDEALRNIVAVGGDPAQTVLVDNFCWPDPLPGPHNAHAAHKLGQLVRCAVGLYDAALIFASPFVSGKDSMKNDFIGKYADGTPAKISVPPTVLVSAMARVKNSQRTVSSEFKQAGDVIFLLGAHSAGLGCSEFAGYWEIAEESLQLPPGIDLRANQLLYSALHTLIAEGLIASCHDVSDGGVLPCVAESAIGGNLGANLLLDTYGEKWDLVDFCFNEAGGRLVISVDPQQLGRVTAALGNLPLRRLGVVSAEAALRVRGQEQRELFSLRIDTLKQAWQGDH